MKSQINWNNKIIDIQIIISIVRVSEHFSKMLVLSGVFNTRILDTMNYTNQDCACQLYAYSCSLYALSNRQPIKKSLMFLPGYGPIAIADWSNMGFSVHWCSRWNGHIIEYETTAYRVVGHIQLSVYTLIWWPHPVASKLSLVRM
jgi:hypothetical protein